MKPPPFLISAAAVINYVCPTPNTNIVIFGGKILDLFHCGGRWSEMNGLPSWSFAGMRRRRREGRVEWSVCVCGGVIRSQGEKGGLYCTYSRGRWTWPARESQVCWERPVWFWGSLHWDLTPNCPGT